MIVLTDEQEKIVEEAVDFYYNSPDQIFQISGGPGTGKSVVMHEIANRLNLKPEEIAPMAFMGQAAIVMLLNGFYNAKTIHSWVYEPVERYKTKDGKIIFNEHLNRPMTETVFVPKDTLNGIKVIFVDEGGNVPYEMRKDILAFGIKVIVCGDLDQLPSVTGKPAFLYEGKVHYLTKIMRQVEGSSIIYFAQLAKRGLDIPYGFHGDSLVIDSDEITDKMLANVDIMLCGKNETRDIYNKKIRQILGYNTLLPSYGEKLICRKNNWKIDNNGINLANGMLGYVTNNPSIHGFDGKTYTINFNPLLINIEFKNLKCDYKYFSSNYKMRNMIKTDRFSPGEKFEYGYAITTHSSQGSAFRSVLYKSEFLRADIQNNLDYTGITRAREFLIYVKQKRRYYTFK